MTNNTDIIGGVSPLKKKSKWKGRRGKTIKTRYKRDKWQKPTSGGTTYTPTPTKPYTINPDGKVNVTPPGDTTTNITNEGDVNTINQTRGGNRRWVDPVYGEREVETKIGSWDYSKGNPTYKQAWKENLSNITNIYGSFEDYVQDLEDQKAGKKPRPEGYKKPEYVEGGTTKKTKERYLIKEGYWVDDDGGGDQIASITTNKMLGSPNKFTLKGNPMYRNFGIGKNK